MSNRAIKELNAGIYYRSQELIERCNSENIDVLIYCITRRVSEQAKLYRIGRPFSEIKWMAAILKEKWGRPDLSEILLGVGPQYGPRIVTNAAPGMSLHNYGLAADGCPLRYGKLIWLDEGIENESIEDEALWLRYGQIAESIGLEWAGRWEGKLKERVHVQIPDVKWENLIRNYSFS